MTKKLTHHRLTAELVNDSEGPAIMLTQQDGIEEPQCVLVHPWQLRAVCEQLGIVEGDESAAKVIQTLQRRMLKLRDRVDCMMLYLTEVNTRGHTDLSRELSEIHALSDLTQEWCSDFVGEPESLNAQSSMDAPADSLAQPMLL